ncbi:hypothetical protein SAY87_021911 [Trapa incisa]|uniref:LRR receptor-like serine/threonine-protein kinase n=1 Tax=Trapa incisa TaxID=236973 RepID=A0AAN7JXS8_9MYRT|nr:hypothetical protein SAY87_021911 [Trapa incisa]
MKEVWRSKGKGGTLFFFSGAIIIALLSLFLAAHAQPQTQPITDPAEARALETIFQKWGLPALTGPSNNTSGDVCARGSSTNVTSSDGSRLLVECDCSSNKGLTCHIIKLKVYQMNVAGPIPDELWSLTYLTDLALSYNVLTGPLSPSIRNLTRLNNLNLHTNALAGELPKELGMLSNLTELWLGENNFSGPLPSELGNLTNLSQLSIESTGFSGQLPSTLANLQNLWRL